MLSQDKKLVCKECGQEFIFTAREQAFYTQRGFDKEPKRCKSCRKLNRGKRQTQSYSYIERSIPLSDRP